ncbi:hypothetical protein AVEN_111701-1 [Araneus ventricosus]|uniref:Uncharacterized protein n=1 Tax=Araneus ventricosus TaxID=182803 RepID=A0A4Y2C7S4_ARAVE|nr:hypothetical protein AVEN_111701-1 [Araneus ventricosus]
MKLRNQISSCCCRFSYVEGFNQNALFQIMQRSAVCVPHGQFAVEGRFNLFKYEGNGPCPVKNSLQQQLACLSRDSWQDVKCEPPCFFIFPV